MSVQVMVSVQAFQSPAQVPALHSVSKLTHSKDFQQRRFPLGQRNPRRLRRKHSAILPLRKRWTGTKYAIVLMKRWPKQIPFRNK